MAVAARKSPSHHRKAAAPPEPSFPVGTHTVPRDDGGTETSMEPEAAVITKAKRKAAASPPEGHVARDGKGNMVRLGIMQQWIADFLLRSGPKALDEVAAEIKEPAERARTRLRQLAMRGVTVLGEDGKWTLSTGPAVPAEPPPRAYRGRNTLPA